MNRPLLSGENTSRTCRICFDDDNFQDLISPCLCVGGSAYVHRKCLDKWRAKNANGRGFSYCDVCQFKYIIEPVINDPLADRQRLIRFRLLVTRDIILFILALQAFLIGLIYFLKFCDKDRQKIKNLFPSSMSSFGIYYLSSIVIFLALLGFFGLIMYCCGMTENRDNNHVHDPDSCCTGYYCACVGCADCDSGNCGSGSDGDTCPGFLVVICIVFAIIGVFVGILFSISAIQIIIARHTKKLWLEQETKKYIVKDFQGRQDELRNISTQSHSRSLLQQPKYSSINKKNKLTSSSIALSSIATV